MAGYYANFSNQTDRVWTFCVYQELPSSPGLDSVSWKQTTVPTSGFSGVEWQVLFNVSIADYKQDGGIGVYTASQTLSADLGTAWEVIFDQNVQQLKRAGDAPQGNQILIANKSNRIANPGIGMSGQGSVYKRDVLSGSSAQFVVTPVYYVALFNDLVLGEVISDNVIVGPLQLEYPGGLNAATVSAKQDGDNISLVVEYGSQTKQSNEVAEQRIAFLDQRREALASLSG